MRFRQSTIRTWMACPLQAKFAHISNLPRRQNGKASFGTVIHHALELFNQTSDVEAAVEDFQYYWHNPEKLGVEPDYWPKYTTYGGLREDGIRIVRDYADKLKWENRTVIATEHPFLVPFGDHELSGTVDLIELRRNHNGKEILRVVDYKCLALETPVLRPDGGSSTAGELRVGDVVVGERNGVLVPTRIEEVINNGYRECLRITTFSGRKVDVTPEHPFLTRRGWVKAADLVPCASARHQTWSWVRVGLGWEGAGPIAVEPNEAWLLGALLGDGSLSGSNFSITNIDSDIVARCAAAVESLGFDWRPVPGTSTYRICNRTGRKAVRAWRDAHGLVGDARTKVVPSSVVNGGREAWVAFLAGYLCTDGSVHLQGRPPQPRINWHSVNRPMLAACQQMMALLGVRSRIETVKANTVEGVSYRLTVSDRYGAIETARLLVGQAVGPKRDRLEAVAGLGFSKRPETYEYEPIASIERLPVQPTVGIQTGCGTHVTGGLVTHNTNTRKPTKGELAVNVQFTVYTYATLQPEFWTGIEGDPDHPGLFNGEFMYGAFQDVPRRGIWNHLWTGSEIDAGTRADSDFMRLYRVCEQIARAVELDVYVPNISGESCTICDFANDPCPVQIPERAERAQEEDAWL